MLSIVLTMHALYRYEERYAQDKQEQAEVMRHHEVQLEEMRGRIEKEMNEKLELKTAELERSQKAWFGGKKTKAAQEELVRLQKEKEQQLAQAEQEKNAYLQQQRLRQEAKEKEHVEKIRLMEAKLQAIEAKEAAEEKAKREAEERQRQEAAATRVGWATQLDANSGKQFWAHAQSGASQWDVPTAAQLRQQAEEVAEETVRVHTGFVACAHAVAVDLMVG
jgi:colicin import membrane protein